MESLTEPEQQPQAGAIAGGPEEAPTESRSKMLQADCQVANSDNFKGSGVFLKRVLL